jgi:hypothetical protein
LSQADAAGPWRTDFEKARAESESSGKYLLLYFTESDGDPMSDVLEKEVLAHSNFTAFAASNLVCVPVDIPRKKRLPLKVMTQNRLLRAKYNVAGSPWIVMLAPGGEEVGRASYRRGGAKPYVEFLQSLITAYERTNPAAAEAVRTARANPVATNKPPEAAGVLGVGTASGTGSVAVGVSARTEYEMRTWTSVSGKTVEARFVSVFNGMVVLLKTDGQKVRIAASQLSDEDRIYLEDAGATP